MASSSELQELAAKLLQQAARTKQREEQQARQGAGLPAASSGEAAEPAKTSEEALAAAASGEGCLAAAGEAAKAGGTEQEAEPARGWLDLLGEGSEDCLSWPDSERSNKLFAAAQAALASEAEAELASLAGSEAGQSSKQGNALPTFGVEPPAGSALARQVWQQRQEFVLMQIKFCLKDLLAAHKRAEKAQVFAEKRLEAAFLPPADYLRHWEKDQDQRELLQLQLARKAAEAGLCCPCWLAAWCWESKRLQAAAEQRLEAAQPAAAPKQERMPDGLPLTNLRQRLGLPASKPEP